MYGELSPGKGRVYLLKPDTACLLYRAGQTLQRIEFKSSPPLLEAMGLRRQLDVTVERGTGGGLAVSFFSLGRILDAEIPPRVRLELGEPPGVIPSSPSEP